MARITGVHYLTQTVTDWSTPVATTITSTGGGVVKGTMAVDQISYKREGRFAFIRMDFQQTLAGTAGTGPILVLLPNSLVADTNYLTLNNSTNSATAQSPGNVGHSSGNAGASLQGIHAVIMHDSTHFKIVGQFGAVQGIWGPSQALSNNISNISCWLRVPIVGWTETN